MSEVTPQYAIAYNLPIVKTGEYDLGAPFIETEEYTLVLFGLQPAVAAISDKTRLNVSINGHPADEELTILHITPGINHSPQKPFQLAYAQANGTSRSILQSPLSSLTLEYRHRPLSSRILLPEGIFKPNSSGDVAGIVEQFVETAYKKQKKLELAAVNDIANHTV